MLSSQHGSEGFEILIVTFHIRQKRTNHPLNCMLFAPCNVFFSFFPFFSEYKQNMFAIQSHRWPNRFEAYLTCIPPLSDLKTLMAPPNLVLSFFVNYPKNVCNIISWFHLWCPDIETGMDTDRRISETTLQFWKFGTRIQIQPS